MSETSYSDLSPPQLAQMWTQRMRKWWRMKDIVEVQALIWSEQLEEPILPNGSDSPWVGRTDFDMKV